MAKILESLVSSFQMQNELIKYSRILTHGPHKNMAQLNNVVHIDLSHVGITCTLVSD